MQNAPLGALCISFDLRYAIIGLETQFSVFMRMTVHTGFTIYDIFLLAQKSFKPI